MLAPDDHDPWTVPTDAPADAEPHDLLRLALHFALLAPSPGNTQPWRFLLDGERVELYSDPSRRRPAHDPDDQQRLLAGGSALALLRVALRAFGLAESTELLPGDHPDLLARVTLDGSVAPSPEDTWLLQAAPKRRTHRGLLASRPVRPRLLERLVDLSRETGASLLALSSHQRAALARRVDAAAEQAARDDALRDERLAWPTAGPEPFEATDGGPARGDAILEGSPVLALLTTPGDAPHDWLIAGQALARVLLRGRVDHLYASFFPAVLARAADRARVAEEAAVLGDMSQSPGHAQVALRLGYGSDLPAVPRRPLADVLLAARP
ncbi:MAG: hypothetical protein JNL82_00175 [Myxococcales bacterium]|nr:hypothetical protein [Myxococcales bacterium]